MNNLQTDTQFRLETLRSEKEQVDEVLEEVQLLELSEDFDEDLGGSDEEQITGDSTPPTSGAQHLPFKIGDAFVYVTLEKGVKLLEAEQTRIDKEIEEFQQNSKQWDDAMKKLKVELYAKFGNNISKSSSGRITRIHTRFRP